MTTFVQSPTARPVQFDNVARYGGAYARAQHELHKNDPDTLIMRDAVVRNPDCSIRHETVEVYQIPTTDFWCDTADNLYRLRRKGSVHQLYRLNQAMVEPESAAFQRLEALLRPADVAD